MNKNKILHAASAALALAVTVGGAVAPVFAESAAAVAGVSGEQTDVADPQTVTVSGLKAGSTVKLYQIVDGYYKDGKLVKYVLMDPTNGKVAAISNDDAGQSDKSNDIITEDEITTIANNIQSGAFTADKGVDMTVGTEADANGKVSASASVEPGMYIALATDPSGDEVYNPAVIAVNITDVNNNTAAGGSVDMTKFFRTGDLAEEGGSGTNVYLKSSTSGADKKITGSTKAAVEAEGDTTGEKTPVNAYGDTIAEGDTAHFKIDGMTIPSFSADYTKPQYIITDTIDDSFANYENLVVKVGGTAVEAGANTYTVTPNGHAFKIEFNENYLKDLRGTDASARAVEVTYDSVLNNATLNFSENHNRAEIKYSNSPTDEKSFKTIDKDTYHYTFGIGADIDSESGTSKKTFEFNKVTGKHTKFTDGISDAPLAGATFTLYSDADCKTVAKTVDQAEGTAVSDADGHITFTGLDEGTYYLKETVAPKGYTLADQTYRFVVKAALGADGIMTGYTVTTSYKDATHADWTDAGTATYTATATKADDGSLTYAITRGTGDNGAIAIVDSKLQTLPSTGGAGTIGLTVAAAAGMAIFVTVYERNKNKEASDAE